MKLQHFPAEIGEADMAQVLEPVPLLQPGQESALGLGDAGADSSHGAEPFEQTPAEKSHPLSTGGRSAKFLCNLQRNSHL